MDMGENSNHQDPKRIAARLSGPMISALHSVAVTPSGHQSVLAGTNTVVALIDRGLVFAGPPSGRKLTALGREVAIAAGVKIMSLGELHAEAIDGNDTRDMRIAAAWQESPAYRYFVAAVRQTGGRRGAMDRLHSEAINEDITRRQDAAPACSPGCARESQGRAARLDLATPTDINEGDRTYVARRGNPDVRGLVVGFTDDQSYALVAWGEASKLTVQYALAQAVRESSAGLVRWEQRELVSGGRTPAPVAGHMLANCGPLTLALAPGDECPTCGGIAVAPAKQPITSTDDRAARLDLEADRRIVSRAQYEALRTLLTVLDERIEGARENCAAMRHDTNAIHADSPACGERFYVGDIRNMANDAARGLGIAEPYRKANP